jgi:2,4-dienoyl-CoA reductase-like NADH-dependent reductase (Old Yellow Enzyme family)
MEPIQAHYASLARGGARLVIVEATAVSPEGRISWADVGLWNDEQADALAAIAAEINKAGAAPGIRIAHARAGKLRPTGHRPSGSQKEDGQVAEAKEIAWKVQHRLHKRYARLAAKGKDKRKIVTAVGRELLGFIWALGTRAEATARQRIAA